MQLQEQSQDQKKFFEYPRSGPWIYVACLASYNNGFLHGAWIYAAQDYENIIDEIGDMLKKSPVIALYGEIAEEWAIHDYEGFGDLHINEYIQLSIRP